jgi:D-sedoheptulose 7-phosphate isomerase
MKKQVDQILTHLMKRRPELSSCRESLIQAFQLIATSQKQTGKILICGNGGSAADAGHIVGELLKAFENKRSLSLEEKKAFQAVHPEIGPFLADKLQKPIRALSLVDQTALITAVANDTSADLIFAQQVYSMGLPQDVFLGITTSGNSRNVIQAVLTAKAMNIKTIALTGPSGGKIREFADCTILAPGRNTPEIQESHLPIYHTLCLMLEEEFFGESDY